MIDTVVVEKPSGETVIAHRACVAWPPVILGTVTLNTVYNVRCGLCRDWINP